MLICLATQCWLEQGRRTAADEHASEAEVHAQRDVRPRIACRMRAHEAQVSHEYDRATNVSLHCVYRIFCSVGAAVARANCCLLVLSDGKANRIVWFARGQCSFTWIKFRTGGMSFTYQIFGCPESTLRLLQTCSALDLLQQLYFRITLVNRY